MRRVVADLEAAGCKLVAMTGGRDAADAEVGRLRTTFAAIRAAVGAVDGEGILAATERAARYASQVDNVRRIERAGYDTIIADIRNAIGAFGGEGIVDGVKRFVANAEATYARAVTERDAARNAESGLRIAIEDMRRRLAGVS